MFLHNKAEHGKQKQYVLNMLDRKYANWLGGVAKIDAGMNGSRNESTARKMARGKTQTAAE